jgi:hypothetical protein
MDGNIVQEVNTTLLVSSISRKNKKMQAILLQNLELYMDKSSPEYEEFRKVILDESNNLTRAIIRSIFGDVDALIV